MNFDHYFAKGIRKADKVFSKSTGSFFDRLPKMIVRKINKLEDSLYKHEEELNRSIEEDYEYEIESEEE